MYRKSKITLAVGLFAGLTAISASGAESSFQIEEVIVTAQKVEENIQDIPSVVNMVSGETLDKLQIQDFEDIAQVTAGLSLDAITARKYAVSMRGVQTHPDGGFQDGVAIYVNGMPVRSDVAFQQIFDLDRVEVIRGPQGTLQGNTSPAGAINMHTRKPNMEEVAGNIQTTFSDDNGFYTQAAMDAPIIPGKLAMRIAAVYDEGDINSIENITSGRSATTQTKAGRITLAYVPNDVFDATLIYEYLDKQADGDEIMSGPGDSRNPKLSPFDRKALSTQGSLNTNKIQTGNLTMNWDINDNHRLTSITGYYDSNQQAFRDDDSGNYTDLDKLNSIPVLAERQMQEIRLSSHMSDSWDSIVGVYYSKNVQDILVDLAPTSIHVLVDIPSEEETLALFTHHKFQLNDASELQMGVRFQKVSKFSTSDLVLETLGGYEFLRLPSISPDLAHASDAEEVTGSIKYSYTVNPDLMIYASYDQSFRPGGVTASTTAVADGSLLLYGEESSDGFEVGFKSTWWDNRARLNAAIFYQSFDDAIYRSPKILTNGDGVPGTDGKTISLNFNGDTIVRGMEVEFEGLILENWSVGGNFSYVDAKYDNATIPCSSPDPTTQVEEVPFCDTSGRIGTEPNISATVNSSYTFPIGSMEGYVNALIKYQDSRHDDVLLVGGDIPAFSTTNLYMGVRRDNWDVSVWVKNLFDKDAEIIPGEIVANTTFVQSRPNKERTAGVTLRYSF